MNKDALYEFVKKVDSILWKDWDPIGCGVPDDEYTSYALMVAGMVWNNADKQSVLDYLYNIENDWMGLPCSRKIADLKNSLIVDSIIDHVKVFKAQAFPNFLETYNRFKSDS
jgi:hypothetical protein